MSNEQRQTRGQGRGARLSWQWKFVISLLIVFHLAAVFVAPWSAPPPSSALSRDVAKLFLPYQSATHLLHGYRFFAPQPEASHLVEYELTFTDGSKRTGRFPDLKEEWPRLFYHRHFMLSEFLNGSLPGDPPPMLERDSPGFKEFLQMHEKQTQLSLAFKNAYAQYLLRANGAEQVKLTVIEHMLPSPEQILAGIKLTDPRSYRVVNTETFTANQENLP